MIERHEFWRFAWFYGHRKIVTFISLFIMPVNIVNNVTIRSSTHFISICPCNVWRQSLQPLQELPDTEAWGWKDVDGCYLPMWMMAPEASKVLKELKHCSCRKNYDESWVCGKFEMPCTELCKCDGQCSEHDTNVWLDCVRNLGNVRFVQTLCTQSMTVRRIFFKQ